MFEEAALEWLGWLAYDVLHGPSHLRGWHEEALAEFGGGCRNLRQAVYPMGRRKGPQHPESGVRAAARELGVNREDARRATKVASLSDEAQRAAAVSRRKEIYEALHPETGHGGSGRGRDRVAESATLTDRFTAATAKATVTVTLTIRAAMRALVASHGPRM